MKHPKGYLDPERTFLDQCWDVENDDRPFEYFMNRMRLFQPIPKAEFTALTSLSAESVEPLFKRAYEQGLLEQTESEWQVTETGHRYLNSLLTMLMED